MVIFIAKGHLLVGEVLTYTWQCSRAIPSSVFWSEEVLELVYVGLKLWLNPLVLFLWPQIIIYI